MLTARVEDDDKILGVLGRNFVPVCLDGVYYLCRAPVVVVQTVEHWERDDLPLWVFYPFWSSCLRNPLLDSLMRSSLIEVPHIFLDYPMQMAFPQN
jgi:hypothetical protein